MSSKVLRFECLPLGTKPNTVYAQFHDKKHYQQIKDIYTHPAHKGKAWVIFSSDIAPGKHECWQIFGEGQKYRAYSSSLDEIPFDIGAGATKIERYSDFVNKKAKERRSSTLIITGLTSRMWEDHLEQISPRGIEDNTAYCEKEKNGEVKVQFFDKEDAFRTWEDVNEKGMFRVYHITARFVDDVFSEKEVMEMQGDHSDNGDDYFYI